MNEPHFFEEPFDDGLQNLFTRAAAETGDTGFTEQVMATLERGDRTRAIAVAAAGVGGAAIAATQLRPIGNLISSLGAQASVALDAAPRAEGALNGASPMLMGAVGLSLLVLTGIAALVRR